MEGGAERFKPCARPASRPAAEEEDFAFRSTGCGISDAPRRRVGPRQRTDVNPGRGGYAARHANARGALCGARPRVRQAAVLHLAAENVEPLGIPTLLSVRESIGECHRVNSTTQARATLNHCYERVYSSAGAESQRPPSRVVGGWPQAAIPCRRLRRRSRKSARGASAERAQSRRDSRRPPSKSAGFGLRPSRTERDRPPPRARQNLRHRVFEGTRVGILGTPRAPAQGAGDGVAPHSGAWEDRALGTSAGSMSMTRTPSRGAQTKRSAGGSRSKRTSWNRSCVTLPNRS